MNYPQRVVIIDDEIGGNDIDHGRVGETRKEKRRLIVLIDEEDAKLIRGEK